MLSNVVFKRPTKPIGALRDKTSIRRSRFLEQQTRVRKSHFEDLREKALDALLNHTGENTIEVGTQEKSHGGKKRTSPFAHQSSQYVTNHLVIPDFLVDVPADLANEWLAFLRPEGQRVVLIASGGRCCVFNKSGFFVESFQTDLPHHGCTILDGVLVTSLEMKFLDASLGHLDDKSSVRVSMDPSNCRILSSQPNDSVEVQTTKQCKRKEKPRHFFIICDCICWNDCSIGDSSAECRYFMLKSRFDEMKDALVNISSSNRRSLRLVEVVEARAEELARLYYHCQAADFIPDSIIFVHKQAIYSAGVSQLYLCWRDSSISRFPIDTIDSTGRTVPRFQQANLLVRLDDAAVLTEDRVVVARFKKEALQKQLQELPPTIYLTQWMKEKIKDELLIRVSIQGLALDALPNDVVQEKDVSATDLLVGMKIIGTPSPKRVRAETLNRIVQQFILRQTHIRKQGYLPLQVDSSVTGDSCPVYNGPLLDFEVILRCASTGEPHSRMLLLRGERNMEEFLEDEVFDSEEKLEDWC